MDILPWLILFLPLGAAIAISLSPRENHFLNSNLSIGAIAAGFCASLALFIYHHNQTTAVELAVRWLAVGDLQVDFGLRLDRLSLLMLLIVTGVGTVIHIYSRGYLKGDPGFSRYFASLSLFTFSMLGIVLANNFLQMFIFWELVGVSSYLLIGFWYERAAAADAAKKAFLTNRLGDFGFMLGIIMVWAMTNGTVHFGALEQAVKANPALFGTLSGVVGLLIFCGAMGKSAQFPLHVWLPDAMEGPTPVSALIHAATMVAAGVYMLCRVFFLYTTTAAWPESMAWLQGVTAADIIAWIGGITSLLAAFIAVQQNDIKRILAYSTLSQLGYMVMAVGLGGPEAALYHLTTHAAFKALLFLGAGAVIHSLHHEQDIWRMGGLRSRMPITYWTFLAGTLSLSGVPPFSGFFSKDEVLATAAHHSIALFIMALLVAVLTTFYMFRLFFVAFRGAPRSEAADHAHEAPGIMTWPLIILSIPTLLAGLWGIDHFLEAHFYPGAVAHHGSWAMALFAPFGHSPLAAMLGLGAVFVGFTLACSLYSGATRDPLPLKLSLLSRALRRRLYFDEIYQGLINLTHENFARLSNWIDRWLIGGLAIRGLHGGVEIFGRILRLVQTGNLQTYAFLFLLGVAGLLYFFLYR